MKFGFLKERGCGMFIVVSPGISMFPAPDRS